MTLVAFGYHPVISILQSPYFCLKKVIIQDKYQNDKVLSKWLAEKKVNFQLLTKGEFERASFSKKSQGIVALLHDYDYLPLSRLWQIIPQQKHPLLVMLDRVEDPHNFGAILRTSAAFSVDGIIIASRNQVPVNSTVIKVSAGGIAHVPICRVNSLGETVNELKKRGYKVVAATIPNPLSISEKIAECHKFQISSPTCLIFGNEHHGIKKSLLQKSDCCLFIPVNNNVSSLNVATSCGIILSWLVLSRD
ncbi:21715_t:CDS:1 [Gigaspora margarita]|uniref:21715_t:CDS:1 n=1 Tax=Gigaspora margarita TaxID=4874 RepID=A0ABM8VV92_GIGMA|nr:21715_t:CDS:1 [Gigaspora margarita]